MRHPVLRFLVISGIFLLLLGTSRIAFDPTAALAAPVAAQPTTVEHQQPAGLAISDEPSSAVAPDAARPTLSQIRAQTSQDGAFFSFPQQLSLDSLWSSLQAAASRWRSMALWLPLLLITPGWLLVWVLRPGGIAPITPLVTGLSLAMAPFSYLLLGFTPLRLYEPLIHSLFQATALLLLLLMLRDLPRVREGLLSRWGDGLWLLLGTILLAIATWLLAGTALAPTPLDESLRLISSELVTEGRLSSITAPLPPATMGATMAQMTRQPVEEMFLLAVLMLGVAVVPALFGLAAELSEEPPAAVWVLPLTWLWWPVWAALTTLDLSFLYGFALLPVAVAMGVRALRTTEHPWRTLLLAALPLAALAFVQGVGTLLAWLLTMWLALLWRRPADPTRPATPAPDVLMRAFGWLLLAMLLYFPAWWFGENPMTRVNLMLPAYALVISTAALALLGGLVARSSRRLAWAIALIAVVLCVGLSVWRGTPEDTFPALALLDQWLR